MWIENWTKKSIKMCIEYINFTCLSWLTCLWSLLTCKINKHQAHHFKLGPMFTVIREIMKIHIDIVCSSISTRIRIMVFTATFNNISVISWRSVLLVEETGVPGENNKPVVSHWQTLSHNVVSSTPRHERDSISQL